MRLVAIPGVVMCGFLCAVIAATTTLSCSSELDLGSDVLWSARHEGNNLDEWSAQPGGGVSAFPGLNTAQASVENAHHGAYAARLSINAANGIQSDASLARRGVLPAEAYYSAWYYLPRSVTVGTFWVIFKLRMRDSVDDSSTERELYDLNLTNLPSGEMTLRLYDHRSGDVPLDVPAPVVPVGRWFHLEAFYRNAPDVTGRATYWLDGRMIVDISGKATSPTPWVHWIVGSIAEDLMPSDEILFIDDAAISLSRVGPQGVLAK